MNVSIFLSNDDNENNEDEEQIEQKKHLVSKKIQKIFLILSYSFWSKLVFINSSNQNNTLLCILVRIQPIVCFPINIVLVLVSTFCPLVSTVYLFFIKYSNVVIGKLFYEGILCIIAKVKKSERCNNGNEETSSSNGGNKNKLFNFILQFFFSCLYHHVPYFDLYALIQYFFLWN